MPIPLLLVACLVFQQPVSESEKREFVDKNTAATVEKGIRGLRSLQRADGGFRWAYVGQPHGSTALAIHAFLSAGLRPTDPSVSRAIQWLLKHPMPDMKRAFWNLHEVSGVVLGLSHALPHLPTGAERDQVADILRTSVDWLVAAQRDDGGWGYGRKTDPCHHFNGQYAILGLAAAGDAGMAVKADVWERAIAHLQSSQGGDGSWRLRCDDRRPGSDPPAARFTAAGVMGLALANRALRRSPDAVEADPAIRRGITALGELLEPGIPRFGPHADYWLLYVVDRAGAATNRRTFGAMDWHLEGAWNLIRDQGPDGLWVKRVDQFQFVHQCYALIFLRRGYAPVPTPSNAK